MTRYWPHLLGGLVTYGLFIMLPPSDVAVYQNYAQAFLLHGGWPREYPPLAIVPMLLPRLLPVPYVVGWGFFTLVLWTTLLILLDRPLLWVGLAPFATVVLGTYDVWPILAMILAYLLIERRPTLSWALLGAAVALKLFPLLLVPLWWQQQRRGWWAFFLPLITFYPPLMWSVLHYQTARQAEWESTVSILSWLFGSHSMQVRQAFGSIEYFNGLSGTIGTALEAVFLGVFAWAVVGMRQKSLPQRALVVLSAWFLSEKVLSAQYVLWVVAWAAVEEDGLWPWIQVLWLTALEYPWLGTLLWLRDHVMFQPGSLSESIVALRQAVWLIALGSGLVRPQKEGTSE